MKILLMTGEIARLDPWGISMVVVAMSVIFLALLTLYLVFKLIGARLDAIEKRNIQEQREREAAAGPTNEGAYAAIAVAIHLYSEELHDVENTVLTINKVSRAYSPWSSRYHGLNSFFKTTNR